MKQEVFIFHVGQFDRERVINAKLAELNEQYWRVISFGFVGENKISFLAEYIDHPVMFSFKNMTEDEMQEARQYLVENYTKHQPILLPQNVEIHRISDNEAVTEVIEITPEDIQRLKKALNVQ